MRWMLAGIAFALAVALAIGTAAMRAANTRLRQRIDAAYVQVKDRSIELQRLRVRVQEVSAPDRLAATLRQLLRQRRPAAAEAQP